MEAHPGCLYRTKKKKKAQMTANNNVRACLISWVHVSKCLHIAACFMSDLSGGHTAVRSHALTHVETLKYTRRLSLQAYLAAACTRGQRGEKINKIRRDCPPNYQNEEEGYVTAAAARRLFCFFLISPVTSSVLRWQETQFITGMTPGEVIYAGLHSPR